MYNSGNILASPSAWLVPEIFALTLTMISTTLIQRWFFTVNLMFQTLKTWKLDQNNLTFTTATGQRCQLENWVLAVKIQSCHRKLQQPELWWLQLISHRAHLRLKNEHELAFSKKKLAAKKPKCNHKYDTRGTSLLYLLYHNWAWDIGR